jgi:hypothetical protein
MSLGRPPKPAVIQEASGAWIKNPSRRRTEAKIRAPIDTNNIPEKMNEHETKCWHELIFNAPLYVLKNSDAYIVEAAARTLSRVRCPELYGLSMTQQIQVMTQLRAFLSLMGMTPSDRARVQSEPDGDKIEDALDEFSN